MEVEVKLDTTAIDKKLQGFSDAIRDKDHDLQATFKAIGDRLQKLESAPAPTFTENELNKRYKELRDQVNREKNLTDINIRDLQQDIKKLESRTVETKQQSDLTVHYVDQKIDTEQASRNKQLTSIEDRVINLSRERSVNDAALFSMIEEQRGRHNTLEENIKALQQQIVRLTDEIVTLKDIKVDVKYHTNKLDALTAQIYNSAHLTKKYIDEHIDATHASAHNRITHTDAKIDHLDRSMTEYVNQRSIARLAEINELRRDFEFYKQNQQATIGGRMSDIKETLKTDATEAGYRLAGKQLTKLTIEPLAALIARGLGEDSEAGRKKAADFLKTDFGRAVASGLLSVGLGTIPGVLPLVCPESCGCKR